MLGSRMWSPKRKFWWGNLGGSRELQYEDQEGELSLCYESCVNGVKNVGTSRTFFIFVAKHVRFFVATPFLHTFIHEPGIHLSMQSSH